MTNKLPYKIENISRKPRKSLIQLGNWLSKHKHLSKEPKLPQTLEP